MAELITGKLRFNQEKRKWQVEFFNEKKQQQTKMPCAEDEISSDIPKDEAEEIEVQFERKPPHGEPIHIRLAGKDFIASTVRKPQAAPSSPNRQQSAGNRGVSNARREGVAARYDGESDDLLREFHNPYNFVPAVPRDRLDGVTNDLGDKPPAGHDRFRAELLSGCLHVQMTVKTPLLLPDTSRVDVINEHKTFPVREDSRGKPVINPTSIKGMLRSAYETVTNSRFSVFQNHDERLAFRMESIEGAMSVPARIEDGKIVLYTGASEISDKGKPLNESGGESNAILCAAWLPMNQTQRHGTKLAAWLEKIQHINRRNNRDFKFWRVRAIASTEADLGTEPSPSRDTRSSESLGVFIKTQGFVCNTGNNISNKHDERFFFIHGRDETEVIKANFDQEKHRETWDRLIKDYRQEHSEKNGELKAAPKAERQGQSVEWSRHVQRTGFNETAKDAKLKAEDLANSPLCYARVAKENDSWIVEELYPVAISRRLHRVAPDMLLPRNLHPANDIEELSPADRVFGWVRQGNRGSRQSAYRGQVRIGVIDCESADAIEKFDENGLPLQILGQPKPQQGRFYVAESQKKAEAQTERRNNEYAGYRDGRGLRGRKVYPHHKLPSEIETAYWDKPHIQRAAPLLNKYFQEFRRPDGANQRDNQNRSVSGWVKPSTLFKFDIHFTNLSHVELGALIWLLDLPEEHFHRLGGGKPLGFGSVALTLHESEILKGEELKKRYFALDNQDLVVQPRTTETDTCLKAFEAAMNAYPGENGPRILRSFLASAKGFEKPIHYPRARRYKEDWRTKQKEWINPDDMPLPPHEEGLAYEWFVENSKPENRLVLSDLVEDEGLPIFNHKVTKGG